MYTFRWQIKHREEGLSNLRAYCVVVAGERRGARQRGAAPRRAPAGDHCPPLSPPASATSATADGLAPEGASQTKKFCLQVIKKRPRKKFCLQVIKKRPRNPDVADVHEWCSAATGAYCMDYPARGLRIDNISLFRQHPQERGTPTVFVGSSTMHTADGGRKSTEASRREFNKHLPGFNHPAHTLIFNNIDEDSVMLELSTRELPRSVLLFIGRPSDYRNTPTHAVSLRR
ncbi:hypothetical protein EVAR_48404_1 [Eumeta japonica]|uniref:Uncharacterized protein n=1 Tax=Eumeta variegata TaxID=151549 RepID=A0A4C1XRM9_EUMVA|nr:hypothetical protein EVAR_48404_1 [Eumeta japonica]